MNENFDLGLRARVLRWLQAGPHRRVLAVGRRAGTLLGPEHPHGLAATSCLDRVGMPTAPLTDWLERLATRPRFDAAVVCMAGDEMDETDAALVLGRIRDLHAARMLVLTGAAEGLRNDLIALGMERLSTGEEESCDAVLYAFDLGRYKRTPDWLNARHWANPENWGRYRW
jgi:hypothetical protein